MIVGRCQRCNGLMVKAFGFGTVPGDSNCVICGHYVCAVIVPMPMPERKPKTGVCITTNCNGVISPVHNKTGLCESCHQKKARLERRAN